MKRAHGACVAHGEQMMKVNIDRHVNVAYKRVLFLLTMMMMMAHDGK